jgi:hypothetical protein
MEQNALTYAAISRHVSGRQMVRKRKRLKGPAGRFWSQNYTGGCFSAFLFGFCYFFLNHVVKCFVFLWRNGQDVLKEVNVAYRLVALQDK